MRLTHAAASSALFLAGCGSSSPQASGDAGAVDVSTRGDAKSDLSPPPPPLCTVASTGTSGLVLSGRLLLPAGPTTGELFIASSGTIACAAASCASSAGYSSATHIACPGGVISPGLINPHDHTEYATRGPEPHGNIRYEHRNDWRDGAEGATPLPTVESSGDPAVNAAQELRFVLAGATSIVGTGGNAGLARNLAEYEASDWLEGLTGQAAFFETFPLGDDNGVLITSGCGYPDIISAGEAFGSGTFIPHLAEGINLAAENELTCAEQSSNDLVTKRTSVIHGVGADARDVANLRKAGAQIIWSPRSNISLYGNTTSITEYRYAGIPIALGTDWLPSGSMNMLRELACADTFNQKYLSGTFSDEDLFEMVTINAAEAAGFGTEIGSLTVGKFADVAVFDGRSNTDYRAIIAAGVEDVHLVLRAGKVLYGDTMTVAALANDCDAMPVCGEDRSVCIDVPGTTLATIESAASLIYPLFFCKNQTPTLEPTCIPYRDTYPNGISATDRDGDGIADAKDDCPDIFNPIRPMDEGRQSDLDGDGYGDACDAQPLDPTEH
jgi:hypothetical protein